MRTVVILLVLEALAPFPSVAQASGTEPTSLQPLQLLLGTWRGTIDGSLGQGVGVRTYEAILDGQYIVMNHSSVRLPQSASPQGDRHREMAVFSFDRVREVIVYRAFVVEGVVTRYVCSLGTAAALDLTCESERIENGPNITARLHITAENTFVFEEEFTLEGMEPEPITFRNRWVREPVLP